MYGFVEVLPREDDATAALRARYRALTRRPPGVVEALRARETGGWPRGGRRRNPSGPLAPALPIGDLGGGVLSGVLASRLSLERVRLGNFQTMRRPSVMAFDAVGALLAVAGPGPGSSPGPTLSVFDFDSYLMAVAKRGNAQGNGSGGNARSACPILEPLAPPIDLSFGNAAPVGDSEVRAVAWDPAREDEIAVALASDDRIGVYDLQTAVRQAAKDSALRSARAAGMALEAAPMSHVLRLEPTRKLTANRTSGNSGHASLLFARPGQRNPPNRAGGGSALVAGGMNGQIRLWLPGCQHRADWTVRVRGSCAPVVALAWPGSSSEVQTGPFVPAAALAAAAPSAVDGSALIVGDRAEPKPATASTGVKGAPQGRSAAAAQKKTVGLSTGLFKSNGLGGGKLNGGGQRVGLLPLPPKPARLLNSSSLGGRLGAPCADAAPARPPQTPAPLASSQPRTLPLSAPVPEPIPAAPVGPTSLAAGARRKACASELLVAGSADGTVTVWETSPAQLVRAAFGSQHSPPLLAVFNTRTLFRPAAALVPACEWGRYDPVALLEERSKAWSGIRSFLPCAANPRGILRGDPPAADSTADSAADSGGWGSYSLGRVMIGLHNGWVGDLELSSGIHLQARCGNADVAASLRGTYLPAPTTRSDDCAGVWAQPSAASGLIRCASGSGADLELLVSATPNISSSSPRGGDSSGGPSIDALCCLSVLHAAKKPSRRLSSRDPALCPDALFGAVVTSGPNQHPQRVFTSASSVAVVTADPAVDAPTLLPHELADAGSTPREEVMAACRVLMIESHPELPCAVAAFADGTAAVLRT